MHKSKLLVYALIVAFLSFPAAKSFAYFTSYTTAKGGYSVDLGWETEIKEKVEGNQKIVRVDNLGNMPCYVRVRAYSGTFVQLDYSGSNKWMKGDDGWFYYNELVEGKGNTEDLVISITPDKEKQHTDYDVIVIHESAPLSYDENGNLRDPMDPVVWERDITVEEG